MRRSRETTRQTEVLPAVPRLADGLLAALQEVENKTRAARRPVARPAAESERPARRARSAAASAPGPVPEPAPDETVAPPLHPPAEAEAQPVEQVSGAEVARRLGVSRERVRQWAVNPRYGFPLSTGRSGPAKLWRWPEVERWASEHRRRPVGGNR